MKKLLVLLLTFNLVSAYGGKPGGIHWQGEPFFITTRGTKLSVLLKDFGANYGIPVIVSGQVQDVFVGSIKDRSPEDILNELSRLYSLLWYYDNEALYIYKASEVSRNLLTPLSLSPARLKKYLATSGLLDHKACSVKSISGLNAFEVFGVPACLTRVSQLSKDLDTKMQELALSQQSVRIFPLKYVSATDTVYQYRHEPVTVPGLASVLRDMNQGMPIGTTGGQTAPGLPVFSADPRQNAVIVRDRRANMGIYKELIAQLDKKQMPIEISLTIIDVDAGDINQLGIDWAASARLGGGSISFNNGVLDSKSFSTVISNTGNFMVHLNALEKVSKAKVLSQPSVITLDNVQAVLDKNVTFYTKLQGEKIAKLESITTGSLLRVTPRLVNENGNQEVLLVLNIQDGQQGVPLSKEEPLPIVHNSEIATQASLRSGESLLLGGFIQDKEGTTQNKIPLLGDLPLVGGLFRSTLRQSHSVVRLFLIKAEPIQLRG